MNKHVSLLAAVVLTVSLFVSLAYGQQDTTANETDQDLAAVRQQSQKLVDAYNRGQPEELAALFSPRAELIDDAGNTHRGRDEIAAIYRKFVERFPGAQMKLDTESLRLAATGVAVEDGTRTVITEDGATSATNQYVMIHVQRDGKWAIASAREFAVDPVPTPRERLEPLAWMVGDWVDEGADVAVAISCRWAESGSFLLVDFDARADGKSVIKSRQRIGWDPLTGRVRSWVFDSDGGYGQGDWTQFEDRWVNKSTAVLPNGLTGSATIVIQPENEDKFLMTGFDRIMGNEVESDFEATIVRKPPEPAE